MESLKKWMSAVKPLIKEETRFLDEPDDFVTMQRDIEVGALELIVENIARKSRIGNMVPHPKACCQLVLTKSLDIAVRRIANPFILFNS